MIMDRYTQEHELNILRKKLATTYNALFAQKTRSAAVELQLAALVRGYEHDLVAVLTSPIPNGQAA